MSRIRQITETGNALIDGVFAAGNVWDMSSGPIKVKIASANNFENDGGWLEAVSVRGNTGEVLRNSSDTIAWEPADKAGFYKAAQVISSLCGLTFEFTTAFADADVVWWQTVEGRVEASDPGAPFVHEAIRDNATDVQTWGYWRFATRGSWDYTPGGLGFQKLMAFTAASVGLTWAHDGGLPGTDPASPDNKGTFGFNAAPYTMMSFNDHPVDSYDLGGYGFLKTPSAIDTAALQAIYGANMQTATGNNVYSLPTMNVKGTGWTTIWDAGGIDTISAAKSAAPVSINLGEASLKAGDPNAAGYFSRQINVYGGFTIAKGAVIENAVGGTSNDLIVGNNVANVINGGPGNDTLKGLGGRDVFLFKSKPNSLTNCDKILDYNVASDTIQLSRTYFSKIATTSGTLKSGEFWKGQKAHDSNDHIIYNSGTGALYYDPDGTGSAAAIKFAVIGKYLTMSAAEFVIV